MALQGSGAISINNINVELGKAGTTQSSLGQSDFRSLAGVASGAISMSNFYGKSLIFTGQKCLINGVYVSNLQFGYNVLGAASTAIKPTKFYFGGQGSYYDDPWGPGTIYFYGIRASDGGRDLIASYYAGDHDWYTGANTITMSGTVAYTNINIYATGGPKTDMSMTAYFSEWKL